MNREFIGYTILGIAIVILGFCIKGGIDNFTYKDRTIESRGVAERTVKASVGSQRFTITMQGNDLAKLKAEALAQVAQIKHFAIEQGLTANELTIIAPTVEDRYKYVYNAKERPSERYSLKTGISVYTQQVAALYQMGQNAHQLIDLDIVLESDYDNNASYRYEELDSIKPAMISEATDNARNAAEQFAKDSDSKIGLIKHANQGYFSIEGQKGKAPYEMNVRVVTSVEFYLND